MVGGRDLPWLLQAWVTRCPDKDFLIWAPHEVAHQRWSYAAFDQAVRRVAGALAARGVAKGGRVLIHMDNCPELLMTYFACALLGAVAVLGNPRSARPEVRHYIDLVEPQAIVTQGALLPVLAGLARPGCVLAACGDQIGPMFDPAHAGEGVIAFETLTSAEPVTGHRRREPMLDLRVQFTSGTTSRPKAVLSTHANTLFAAQQTAYAYALRHDDVCLVFVPLYHNNGLATLAMSSLWAGGTIVLQPRFSASNFWGPASSYGATWTSVPGAFFLNALAPYQVPEHRFRFWFAGVLPEIEATYRVKTRGHWGMSEMITLPIVGDPFHEGGRLSIGRPAPGNEVAVRHADGRDCEPGETGHLFVRGVRGITIFKEYLNDPEATAASFDADGWFDTGDSVRIGDDGDLYFAHRTKDMLRVGGENVAAAEIEAVIVATGWVKECAVVGKPHHMLDEVPVAFVIPADDAPGDLPDRLIRLCRIRMADFKVVREVRVVEDLPRAALSKIAKHRLKSLLAQEADG
jgi:crotonobetaine/carnitine-CoA ligase